MSTQVSLAGRLKGGWMAIIGRFGASQTLVVLGITYALVIGGGGLIGMLLRRDLLQKRWRRAPGSAWRPADSAKPDLERAKLLS